MALPQFPGDPPKDLSRPLREVKILIDQRHDGARLDRALADILTWRSRTSIHRLIKEGFVDVQGENARPASRVRCKDTVIVRIPKAPEPKARVAPDADSIPVLHEDRWMVVIDKPAGILVHPAGRSLYGTVIHWLHERYRRPEEPEFDVVPRLLHRIDRETSGVLAAGLDEDFHGLVARQFEERKVRKTYLAVVHGRPDQDEGLIDLGIGPARRSSVRLRLEARRDGSGQPALTRYRFLRGTGQYSLVELHPRTGRTHQLRVHMAAIGCPLVGDKLYGHGDEIFLEHLRGELSEENKEKLVLDRHALHSWRFRFFHPERGDEMEIEASLPQDMEGLLD